MAETPVASEREVTIGAWFGEAWDLFKVDLGQHLVVGLIAALVAALLSGTAVGAIVVFGPLACGLFMYSKKRIRGESPQIDDLMAGMKVIEQSLIAGVVYFAVVVAFVVAFFIANAIGSCCPLIQLLMIPINAAGVLLLSAAIFAFGALTPGLIIDRKMKAMDAVKLSYEFGMSNLVMMLVFGAAIAVASGIATMVTLGLGAIVVVPLIAFTTTLIYRDWIGFADSAVVDAEAAPTEDSPVEETVDSTQDEPGVEETEVDR